MRFGGVSGWLVDFAAGGVGMLDAVRLDLRLGRTLVIITTKPRVVCEERWCVELLTNCTDLAELSRVTCRTYSHEYCRNVITFC